MLDVSERRGKLACNPERRGNEGKRMKSQFSHRNNLVNHLNSFLIILVIPSLSLLLPNATVVLKSVVTLLILGSDAHRSPDRFGPDEISSTDMALY